MSTIPFGTNKVWDICRANDIDADTSGSIKFRVAPGFFLKLENSSASGVNPPDIFVLCNASTKGLYEVLKVCQGKRLPLGFALGDAVLHQNIFIVGDFSENAMLELTQAGCTTQQVVGITGKDLANDLKQKLG